LPATVQRPKYLPLSPFRRRFWTGVLSHVVVLLMVSKVCS
jgi:hypothetical protein